MKRKLAQEITLLFSFSATLFLSATAYAYIDPATTSYIIQVVAGVVIACGVAVGILWKRICVFFKEIKIKALEKKLTREAAKREAQNLDAEKGKKI